MTNVVTRVERALCHRWNVLKFHAAPLLGRKSRYGIAAGYHHREQPSYFDDTKLNEQWQWEVYLAARSLMRKHALETVCDVGCGSGYKLVNLLGQFETVGIDLPETIAKVRRKYPDRQWLARSFEELRLPKYDLVICADVIEHVSNPDALMHFITAIADKWIIMSTPAREVFYSKKSHYQLGPPSNAAHLREWTMKEFRSYVSRFMHVRHHQITNPQQGTQMVVGTNTIQGSESGLDG